MAHKLFFRRNKEKACEACQELESGLPCYDCTFALQSPPPKYTSFDSPYTVSLEDDPVCNVSTLAQGASRLGVALALAIDPGQGVVSSHHIVVSSRVRHFSEQRPASTRGRACGLPRNASSPNLRHLNNLIFPERPSSPLHGPSQSSVEEVQAPLAREEELLLSMTLDEPQEEEAEELPLSSDEEPHVLLAALATVTSNSEPTLEMERESSPLPCQLLIPE